MNEKFKKLTIVLADKLEKTTIETMIYNSIIPSNEEIDISDMIDFILSAHLSSLFTCMNLCAMSEEKIKENVKKFIDDMQKFIISLELIKNIETIR